MKRNLQVFTTGQVAKICKVAPRTVSKWYDTGRLKGYRIPGSQDRRIPRESLIKFLKDHGMPLGELESEEFHRILFVACESSFISRAKELLQGAFVYDVANSAFEAGCLANIQRPDSIVIDLSLGRSEAMSIVGNLRLNDNFTTVLMVGLAGEDETAEGTKQLNESGFSEVFKKPFDESALCDRVSRLAEAQQAA